MRGPAAVLIAHPDAFGPGRAGRQDRAASHISALVEALAPVEVDVRIHLPPGGDALAYDRIDRITAVPFRTGSGRPLLQAFVDAFAAGYERVAVVHPLSEQWPVPFLEMAVEVLDRPFRLVLGPNGDGGLYLLGMNELYPTVIDRAPWLHTCHFVTALEQAARTDGEVVLLPDWPERKEGEEKG